MATQRAAGRGSSRRYTGVEKAQAVRLVRALRAELGTGRGTVRRVADQLGFGAESARKWVAQAGIDDPSDHSLHSVARSSSDIPGLPSFAITNLLVFQHGVALTG